MLHGRHVLNERTSLLVLRPVCSLTILGTVAPDAWTLCAAVADEVARLREVECSMPAIGTDAPPDARRPYVSELAACKTLGIPKEKQAREGGALQSRTYTLPLVALRPL